MSRWVRTAVIALMFMLAGVLGAFAAIVLADASGHRVRPLIEDAADRLGLELPELALPTAIPVRRLIAGPPRLPKVIYLNREGAHLTAGLDDSTKNVSSIVANSKIAAVAIPAFSGSNSRWRSLVKCVARKFAPFDVQIVDQRPVGGQPYIMAVVGGTSKVLGSKNKHRHAIGLAPMSGEPIEDAVVLVFSAAARNSLTTVCEAAAMEVAHAYGLDHARHCRDIMTYMPNCGAKLFLDKAIACGEHKDRGCFGGGAKQNSHQMLLELLGPAS